MVCYNLVNTSCHIYYIIWKTSTEKHINNVYAGTENSFAFCSSTVIGIVYISPLEYDKN